MFPFVLSLPQLIDFLHLDVAELSVASTHADGNMCVRAAEQMIRIVHPILDCLRFRPPINPFLDFLLNLVGRMNLHHRVPEESHMLSWQVFKYRSRKVLLNTN